MGERVFSHLKIASSKYKAIQLFFTHAESGHHFKRDIANIEGQEFLTGVINGLEKLLYEKTF